MKKLITIIGILGIILIISIYFINKKQTQKKTVLQKAPIANKQNSTPFETLPIIEQKDNAAIEILPAMDSVSTAKNQVWAGAFQLVWNDLINDINKGPILFEGSQPEMANLLNKSSFSVKDLSADSYYKKCGLVSPKLKQEIEEAIWTKFKEKSRILDNFNWDPAPEKYILYVMLKKDLEYIEKFNKLDDDYFEGINSPIKYFGITTDNYSKSKDTIQVLFYNNSNDFAVTLQSKQGDLIHLYRTNNKKTLAEFYSEMKQKSNAKKDYLRAEDKFKAPVLDFNAQREFKELYNKKIMPSEFKIDRAIEAIQFKMDEVGVKLIAQSIISVGRRAALASRDFYFTGPYIIFMEEPGKQPYFAAYITDPSALNGNN